MVEDAYQSNLEKSKTQSILNDLALEASDYIQQHGIDVRDNFQGISVSQLTALGYDILGCSTMAQVYDLLAEKPVEGDHSSYYDWLIAEPQHKSSYLLLDQTLRFCEKNRNITALDLGSGSGMCAIILTQYADHVVAVDISERSLDEAQEHYQRAAAEGDLGVLETMVLDVRELDFPNESINVITSNALTHYLTFEERGDFYRNIYRLLAPGGRYYQPQWKLNDFESFYKLSPRGRLARYITGLVLDARSPTVRENTTAGYPDGWDDGFELAMYQGPSWNTRSVLQLTKQ